MKNKEKNEVDSSVEKKASFSNKFKKGLKEYLNDLTGEESSFWLVVFLLAFFIPGVFLSLGLENIITLIAGDQANGYFESISFIITMFLVMYSYRGIYTWRTNNWSAKRNIYTIITTIICILIGGYTFIRFSSIINSW